MRSRFLRPKIVPGVSPLSEINPSSPLLHQAPVRVVTAASLFDGHDAAINIMRRVLQSQGAEIIHLGHDRSVDEIVQAAVSEGAHAVAVSSYQGGHMEFFRFLIDRLSEQGAKNVHVFGSPYPLTGGRPQDCVFFPETQSQYLLTCPLSL